MGKMNWLRALCALLAMLMLTAGALAEAALPEDDIDDAIAMATRYGIRFTRAQKKRSAPYSKLTATGPFVAITPSLPESLRPGACLGLRVGNRLAHGT